MLIFCHPDLLKYARGGRNDKKIMPSLPKKILTSKPLIVLEIGVLLFFGFNLGKEILKKNAIEAEIIGLQQEIGKLEQDKDELGSLLQYVQTDSFVEQEARDKLNLVKDDESVLFIPEVDAEPSGAGQATDSAQEDIFGKVAGDSSNVSLWWKYFFEHDKLNDLN